MTLSFALFLFSLGTILGSFANVLIYRTPKCETVFFKRSYCPHCHHTLGPLQLIPLLSFFFQKGLCSFCRTNISLRYPFIEALMGTLILTQYTASDLPYFIFLSLSSLLLITLGAIDLKTSYLPDIYTILLGSAGLLYNLYADSFNDSLLGGLYGLGIFISIWGMGRLIYKKETMGFGDVKLMTAIGLCFGSTHLFLTTYLSFIVGGTISCLLLLFKLKSKKDHIPFGPSIVFSHYLALFFGNYFINYLGLL